MTKLQTILGTLLLILSSGAGASTNPECFKERNWNHPLCTGRVQYVHHGLHHRPHYAPYIHKHYHRDWVAPAVVISGAIIAAEIARQNEIQREAERSRVIIERVERQPVCSEWREVQDGNGRIYRERTCRE